METKLVLIDGNAILHRAYHALPQTMRTRRGEPINAVYGFVSMLLRIVADLKPTHIACAFDLKEPTFRHKEFKGYQAHRPEMDKDLSEQFDKAKKVVRSFGIPIYEKAGYEADDVIGTIATQAKSLDEVVIVTGDKDILQLVTDRVKVYMPVKGLSEAKLMDSNEVYKKLGVRPDQVDEYKALVGDPSDNYKGVAGIGPKTAESLLGKYRDLDEIYANLDKIDERVADKLKAGEDSARQSQKLARIITDIDIKPDWDDMDDWGVGREETIKLFGEIGFRTLTRRVKEFAGSVNFKDVVGVIAKRLKGCQYAIRGTASLVLQGFDMNVEDVDIIADKKSASACNKLLKEYLVKKVKFSESDKFRSYFGEFNIEGVKVEVMGEWQIKLTNNEERRTNDWSQKYDANPEQITQVLLKGKKVPVTKVEIELTMFSQMGRWNAYHKIRKQLGKKGDDQQSLF